MYSQKRTEKVARISAASLRRLEMCTNVKTLKALAFVVAWCLEDPRAFRPKANKLKMCGAHWLAIKSFWQV